MKKIIIISSIILIGIFLLPFIGNKIIEQELSNRIELLESYGMKMSNSSDESNYLSTTKHYEFIVKDGEKFTQYLQQFSNSKLSYNFNLLLNGVIIGGDIKYSNFPFSEDISVDAYPLSFSTNVMQTLKKEDKKFYDFLENILKEKAILYHVNYSIINSEFHGFVKDINESYLFENSAKVGVNLKGFIFDGNGVITSPENLNTQIEELVLHIESKSEKMEVILKNISNTLSRESINSYTNIGLISRFKLNTTSSYTGKIIVDLESLKYNLSTSTQGVKAKATVKSSFETLSISDDKEKYMLNDFNYNFSISDLEKDAFEQLRVLLVDKKSDNTKEMLVVLNQIISKGFKIDLEDLSIAKIETKNRSIINGFKVSTNISLKENRTQNTNTAIDYFTIEKNLNLKTKVTVSKKLFSLFSQNYPIMILFRGYAKEIGEDLVFELEHKDSHLYVNNKKIR